MLQFSIGQINGPVTAGAAREAITNDRATKSETPDKAVSFEDVLTDVGQDDRDASVKGDAEDHLEKASVSSGEEIDSDASADDVDVVFEFDEQNPALPDADLESEIIALQDQVLTDEVVNDVSGSSDGVMFAPVTDGRGQEIAEAPKSTPLVGQMSPSAVQGPVGRATVAPLLSASEQTSKSIDVPQAGDGLARVRAPNSTNPGQSDNARATAKATMPSSGPLPVTDQIPLNDRPTSHSPADMTKQTIAPTDLEARLTAHAASSSPTAARPTLAEGATANVPAGTNAASASLAEGKMLAAETQTPRDLVPASASPKDLKYAARTEPENVKSAEVRSPPSRTVSTTPAQFVAPTGTMQDVGEAASKHSFVLDTDAHPELRGVSDVSTQLRASSDGIIPRAALPRHISAQMASAMQRGGSRPVELHLNPVELGRVKMSVQSIDGSVVVHVVADRPETLDLMRRHVDLLANDFRAIGYGKAEFSFGQQGPDNGDAAFGATDDRQSTEQIDADVSAKPGTDEIIVTAPVLRVSDRVDIRI